MLEYLSSNSKPQIVECGGSTTFFTAARKFQGKDIFCDNDRFLDHPIPLPTSVPSNTIGIYDNVGITLFLTSDAEVYVIGTLCYKRYTAITRVEFLPFLPVIVNIAYGIITMIAGDGSCWWLDNDLKCLDVNGAKIVNDEQRCIILTHEREVLLKYYEAAAVRIPIPGTITAIANGDNELWFVTYNRELWRYDEENVKRDTTFASGTVVNVFAADFNAVVIDTKGDVWARGDNSFGSLGLERCNIDVWTKVPFLKNIVHAELSFMHSAFVDDSGKVFMCGRKGPLEDVVCTPRDVVL